MSLIMRLLAMRGESFPGHDPQLVHVFQQILLLTTFPRESQDLFTDYILPQLFHQFDNGEAGEVNGDCGEGGGDCRVLH